MKKQEFYVKSWFVVELCNSMVSYVKSAFTPVPGGPCKTLCNTCKFHALLGARAAGNARNLGIQWKRWDSAGFHPFWWFSPKKHPKPRFRWKSTPKRTFRCPGPLKRHRKSLGFVGVSTPAPPGHHFHPTELEMVLNHHISMECGGIPPIFTKMG